MILTVFTLFHVVLSVIGIAAGVVVLFGMIYSKMLEGWTAVFLAATAATSLTGFFFPFHRFEPSYVLAAVSLALLAFAYAARYAHRLRGAWRRTYVVTAVIALYLNVLVLVIQLYRKTPALQAVAPTETPVQLVVLAVFLALGGAAAVRFRDGVYAEQVRRAA